MSLSAHYHNPSACKKEPSQAPYRTKVRRVSQLQRLSDALRIPTSMAIEDPEYRCIWFELGLQKMGIFLKIIALSYHGLAPTLHLAGSELVEGRLVVHRMLGEVRFLAIYKAPHLYLDLLIIYAHFVRMRNLSRVVSVIFFNSV